MRVNYDTHPQADILHFDTGKTSVEGHDLGNSGVIVFVGTEDGHDIAAVTIMSASWYLAKIKNGDDTYDAETDTLTLGRIIDAPDKVTENGEITVWWKLDEDFDDDFLNPIGVAIRNVSSHIANMEILSREPAVR